MRYIQFVILLLVCWFNAVSQDSSQTLFAGGMIDVKEGKLYNKVLITITGSIITDIKIGAALPSERDCIDLSEYTVLPGLIDCHTHLTGNWYMDEDDFDEYKLVPASYGILGAINAKKTLEAGFTTVRDVHSNFYGDLAIRDAIEMGWIDGPRTYATGPGLSITGGHGSWGNWLAPHIEFKDNMISIADGEDEVRKEVRRHLKHGVDWIKIFATGGFYSYGTIPGAASYSVEELSIAVEEARKHGRYVCAHAHGADGIKNALRAGVRSIEHGTYLDDECLELFREKDAFLVMDLKAAHYDLIESKIKSSESGIVDSTNIKEYDEMIKRFKKAYDSGVKIAFGSDAGVYPHGLNAEQLGLMKDAGMSEIDVLRSVTDTAAELLSIQDKLGSIEVGKLADIIAIKGNPLTDIQVLENVVFVMKNGKVFKDFK